MTITYLSPDDLTFADYNPRSIDKDNYSRLQQSLDNFSFVEPVVVNKRDGKNIIVGGHQRVRAARDLGVTTIPCNVLELPLGKEKALNRMLNNRKAQGVDDEAMLQEMLMSIEEDYRFMSGDLDDEIEKLQDGPEDKKPKVERYTVDQLDTLLIAYAGESAEGFVSWLREQG